jgi:PAS domain S-box-containing protein
MEQKPIDTATNKARPTYEELLQRVAQLEQRQESARLLEALTRAEAAARFPEENPDPVLRVSADLTILYANKAALSVFAPLGLQVGQPAPPQLAEPARRALSEGRRRVEVLCGGCVYSISACPVGTEVNFYGQEITALKQAEEALRESEERHRKLFETSPDAIVVHRRGSFLFANPAALKLYHADSLAQLRSRNLLDLLHPDDRARAEAKVRQAESGETTPLLATRIFRLDGQPVVVEATGAPVIYEGGPAVLVVLRDFTERQRVERLYSVLSQVNEAIVRIHDEQALYQKVCQILADEGHFPLVWVGLTRGREVAPAAASGEAVGYLSAVKVEVDGELGRGPTGTCVRERRPVINADFTTNETTTPWREAALRHGVRASAAFPFFRGETVIGALTLYAATPGTFDAAQVRLLEALCADLSYALGAIEQERCRSQAEESLRDSEQSLRDADRRKNEFLALLAHELRNPLAPILNSVQIIRRVADNKGLRERAEAIIEKQVRHMVRLIDDLLDVSRIGQDKILLKRESLALATVVESAVETSQPLIDAGGHDLSIGLPAEPVVLVGDRVRLAQVLSNVLTNAAKYSLQRSPIQLSASVEDGMVSIRVKDKGIGIAPEILPRVFDLFVQGDSSLERQRGGLGVGLALCKSLVEMHGGSITATSAGSGQGSEFVIRLPLAPAPAASVESLVESTGAEREARFRVLVVDDTADVAESMATLVELMGHDVRSANDGPTALDLAESFGPDIVLLDIGMPQMSGYEVARRLRQTIVGKRAFLVAMTGWGQEEDRRRASDAGFDQHLTKPVEPGQLDRLFERLTASR